MQMMSWLTLAMMMCVAPTAGCSGDAIATADACQGVTDTAECNACYAAIEPTDADCVAAHGACF